MTDRQNIEETAAASFTDERLASDLACIADNIRWCAPVERSARLREAARRLNLMSDDDNDGGDGTISARIEVFPQGGGFWLTITGEMFGPFANADDALDAIPAALRSLD